METIWDPNFRSSATNVSMPFSGLSILIVLVQILISDAKNAVRFPGHHIFRNLLGTLRKIY